MEIADIEQVVNSNMQSLYEAARPGEVRERNPQGCSDIQGTCAWKCSSGKSGQVDLNTLKYTPVSRPSQNPH